MLQVEIIRCNADGGLARYDVKAEIPGLYTEIVSYVTRTDGTPEGLTREMDAARAHALGVLRARLSMWAEQPSQPIGAQQRTVRTCE